MTKSNNRFIIAFTTFLIACLSLLVSNVWWLEVLTCLLFILCYSCNRKDLFSMYGIIFLMLFIFTFSTIFGTLFNLYDSSYFSKFGVTYYFSSDILKTTLRTVMFYVSAITFAYTLPLRFGVGRVPKDALVHRRYMKLKSLDVIKRLFYILFVLAVLRSVMLVVSAIQYGYVSSVHLSEGLPANRLLGIFALLFNAIGLICLFSAKDRKEYKRFAIYYAIPELITVFTGQRGPGMILVVMLLWIYNSRYKKINISKGVIIIAIALFVMIYVGNSRFGISSKNSIMKSVLNFILNQGECIEVVNFTVLLKDKFTNKVPFLVGYFTDWFVAGDNYTIDAITNKSYLAFHLAYHAFPSAYRIGLTMGTNLIAEVYELCSGNYLLVFLTSFTLMRICIMFEKNLFRSPFWFAFGFRYIMYYFYSPRYSVGKIVTMDLVYILLAMVIYQILSREELHKKARFRTDEA